MIRRNTIQRELVLEAVNELACHATADEIYNHIAKSHPHIGRATVFRNLKLLAEEGAIRRITVVGGADRFDHICSNHVHVQCEKCGRLFDVDMDFVDGLEKKIKSDNGFTFTGYEVLFKGICPDCKRAD
ncbi:MAG: Fur family transcriptional regulator [Candidatus Coproplasma sp.]